MAKRYKSKIKKGVKKHLGVIIAVLFFAVIFAVGGFLTCKVLTKNDGMFLVDPEKITHISVGGVYTEEGAMLTGFGRDMSNFIKTEIKNADGETVAFVDCTVDTTYNVIYSVASVDEAGDLSLFERLTLEKFDGYILVRTIIVGEGAQ